MWPNHPHLLMHSIPSVTLAYQNKSKYIFNKITWLLDRLWGLCIQFNVHIKVIKASNKTGAHFFFFCKFMNSLIFLARLYSDGIFQFKTCEKFMKSLSLSEFLCYTQIFIGRNVFLTRTELEMKHCDCKIINK